MFTLRTAPSQVQTLPYRERYKVDLPAQMAECEANYLRLSKLLLHLEGDQCRFMTRRGDLQCLHLLRVTERSPYTITLQLSQVALQPLPAWLAMPKLTLRLYNDARLAEVLAWEGHKRLRPRYEYPNQAMYQCDEKHQLNLFLGEWLRLCLEEGLSIDMVNGSNTHILPNN